MSSSIICQLYTSSLGTLELCMKITTLVPSKGDVITAGAKMWVPNQKPDMHLRPTAARGLLCHVHTVGLLANSTLADLWCLPCDWGLLWELVTVVMMADGIGCHFWA